MLAVHITGPSQLTVEEIERPAIHEPGDAILMVTTAAIGAHDIAAYEAGAPGIPGRELVGIVVETGPDVRSVDIDDLVVARLTPDSGSAHAEYVRVADADANLVRTTASAEERTVLAGGAVATGIAAAEKALALSPQTLLAWGCDASALSALAWVRHKSSSDVRRFSFDHIAARSTVAQAYGAKRVSFDEGQEIHPDIVLLGSPPKGPSVDELRPLLKESSAVVALDPATEHSDISGNQVIIAKWPTQEQVKRAALAIQLRQIDLTPVVSHVMPLDEAEDAYERVAQALPGTQTVLLKP